MSNNVLVIMALLMIKAFAIPGEQRGSGKKKMRAIVSSDGSMLAGAERNLTRAPSKSDGHTSAPFARAVETKHEGSTVPIPHKLMRQQSMDSQFLKAQLMAETSNINRQLRVMYGFETHVFTMHDASVSLLAGGSSDQAPPIVFTHLLKAGGTQIMALLSKVLFLSPQYVNQDFHATVHNETAARGSPFKIGSIRSPCDYLLSMWAFQSLPYGKDHGHGTWPRECLNKTVPDAEQTLYGQDLSEDLKTPSDIMRFRNWIRATGGKKLHYTSLRSFLALHDESAKTIPLSQRQGWDDGQYFGCMADLSEKDEDRILNTIASTELSSRYDCMIHTETLQADLHTCLIKYADLLVDHRMRTDFLTKVESTFADASSKSKGNPSRHGKCKDYFDGDTEDFVWQREHVFLTKAGYHTCCADPV